MSKASPEHQCHHILDSGQRCGAPHLKKKQFCYFHNKLHGTFTLPGQGHYEAPILDNLHACTIALTHVQRALAKKLITALEAKAMTYTINSARDTLRMIEKSKPIHPNVETDYTPGMRHILWLDDEEENEDGSRSPSSDTRPRPLDRCEAPAHETTNNANNPCTSDPAMAEFEAQLAEIKYVPRSFEELSKKYRMDDPHIAEYFGYTTTGEKLPPRPAEPDFAERDSRPPHPLADAIGLRPWGSMLPPGEAPKWIPITLEELEQIEKAGLPLFHEPHTEQQTYNERRLHISQALRDRKHGSTQELLQVIGRLDQEAIERAPFVEKERQSWLAQKAEEEAFDRM